MNFLQAIFLGLVQGLTEFIPVSSSGHLALVQHFFGIDTGQDLSFEIFLHLGTLLAVILYFRVLLWELIQSLFFWQPTIKNETHRHNRFSILYLVIATAATGILYLLFNRQFEAAYQNPVLVSIFLIITGTIILYSDFYKNNALPAANMGFMRALFIGLAQGLAILPGISRSGSTLSASIFCNIKRKDAAHFSFLLSIPAILAANVKEFKTILSLDTSLLPQYLAGFAVAFVSGYLVIAFLIRLIQGGKLKYFSIYLWVVGLASLSYLYFVR
ncbi:MAG: undecaprenyl-diphosphate phosphatase [Candidatus Cloacimonetes bacterium]|nr:undecaprenyl-diphosphate phosphatase [Candidatus Cloacimonadota bacterium]